MQVQITYFHRWKCIENLLKFTLIWELTLTHSSLIRQYNLCVILTKFNVTILLIIPLINAQSQRWKYAISTANFHLIHICSILLKASKPWLKACSFQL